MFTPSEFPSLRIISHPLIQHKLTILRDRATPAGTFGALLGEIAALMAFEATSDLPVEATSVETPLERTTGSRLATTNLILVPILRAGLGMVEALHRLLPDATIGHIGLHRDHETLEAVPYYFKIPATTEQSECLLLDPMLATGGSAISAVTSLKGAGATRIRLLCLVAAPEGVRRLGLAHPDVVVYTSALDRGLNDLGYIVPGLGDAGDRLFGTE